MTAANPPFAPGRAVPSVRRVGLAYKWQVLMVLLPGMTLFTIDMTFPEATRFHVDDNFLGTVNMAALAATDKFQPLVAIQKSTGTTTPTLDLDWVSVSGWRM